MKSYPHSSKSTSRPGTSQASNAEPASTASGRTLTPIVGALLLALPIVIGCGVVGCGSLPQPRAIEFDYLNKDVINVTVILETPVDPSEYRALAGRSLARVDLSPFGAPLYEAQCTFYRAAALNPAMRRSRTHGTTGPRTVLRGRLLAKVLFRSKETAGSLKSSSLETSSLESDSKGIRWQHEHTVVYPTFP